LIRDLPLAIFVPLTIDRRPTASTIPLALSLGKIIWFYLDLRRTVPVLAQPVWNTARIGQRRSTTTIWFKSVWLIHPYQFSDSQIPFLFYQVADATYGVNRS